MWPVTINVTKCNEIYIAKMHCEFANKDTLHTAVCDLGMYANTARLLCGDINTLLDYYTSKTNKEASAFALQIDGTLIASDDCSTDVKFSDEQCDAIKAALKQAIKFTCA